MLEAQKEAIREIVKLFDQAEDKVKEVEQLDGTISIPSINELRYAGYHLARIFCKEDSAEIDKQINKAKSHCQRAIYDAHEIGIIYMLEQIKTFQEQYHHLPSFVIDVIPHYTESLYAAQEAADFIAKIKESHRENRSEYYKQCEPYYSELNVIFKTFNVAMPLIEQKRIEAVKQDKIETRRFITNTLLIILSIIVAIILGFFSINN